MPTMIDPNVGTRLRYFPPDLKTVCKTCITAPHVGSVVVLDVGPVPGWPSTCDLCGFALTDKAWVDGATVYRVSGDVFELLEGGHAPRE